MNYKVCTLVLTVLTLALFTVSGASALESITLTDYGFARLSTVTGISDGSFQVKDRDGLDEDMLYIDEPSQTLVLNGVDKGSYGITLENDDGEKVSFTLRVTDDDGRDWVEVYGDCPHALSAADYKNGGSLEILLKHEDYDARIWDDINLEMFVSTTAYDGGTRVSLFGADKPYDALGVPIVIAPDSSCKDDESVEFKLLGFDEKGYGMLWYENWFDLYAYEEDLPEILDITARTEKSDGEARAIFTAVTKEQSAPDWSRYALRFDGTGGMAVKDEEEIAEVSVAIEW